MLTEDKVTELFCIADDFCKFFDALWKNTPKFKIEVQIPWCGVSPKTMKNTAEVCPAAGGAKPPESETLEDTGYEERQAK